MSYIVAVTGSSVAYIADSDPPLRIKMLRYEGLYFKDLTLKASSLTHGLLHDEDGEILPNITLSDWSVKEKDRVTKGSDLDGICKMGSKAILLKKGLPKRKVALVLLHEMIHAYEYQLSQPRREIILLYLYGRLSKKLGEARLQAFIDLHSHGALYVPDHSLLFLLKSLELDVRLKKAFGTVAAYGRTEHLSSS